MTASNFSTYIERNARFAATDAKDHVPEIPFIPSKQLYLITCIDPRVEPAAIVGSQLGEAIVARNIGGRVTPALIKDLLWILHLHENLTPDADWFEIAVIHHTDCGSGLLARDETASRLCLPWRMGRRDRVGYGRPRSRKNGRRGCPEAARCSGASAHDRQRRDRRVRLRPQNGEDHDGSRARLTPTERSRTRSKEGRIVTTSPHCSGTSGSSPPASSGSRRAVRRSWRTARCSPIRSRPADQGSDQGVTGATGRPEGHTSSTPTRPHGGDHEQHRREHPRREAASTCHARPEANSHERAAV